MLYFKARNHDDKTLNAFVCRLLVPAVCMFMSGACSLWRLSGVVRVYVCVCLRANATANMLTAAGYLTVSSPVVRVNKS